MISLTRVDPNELNKGQLIHLSAFEKGLEPNTDKALGHKKRAQKVYNLNVEKKEVLNVICCDWFETTLSGCIEMKTDVSFIQLNEYTYLHNTGNSSGNYLFIWKVVYLGEHIGTLQTSPRKNYMSPDQMQFKIENNLLYTVDWLDTYKEFLSVSNFQHKSLTRLDIAIDGSGAKNGLSLTQRHLKGRIIGRKGKAKIKPSFDPNKNIVDFHIGSTSSEKSGTIYAKSNEIEKSNKTYILDYWEKNNLLYTGDVKRFEIRLRAKIANEYDWTKMDDSSYLASIVRSETKNWFEFYYKGKDKNKYRTYKNKTMDWIDWKTISGELLPKGDAVAKSGVHRAKRLIKDSYYLNYVKGVKLNKGCINHCVDEYCLDGWLQSKLDNWYSEWDNEKRFNQICNN